MAFHWKMLPQLRNLEASQPMQTDHHGPHLLLKSHHGAVLFPDSLSVFDLAQLKLAAEMKWVVAELSLVAEKEEPLLLAVEMELGCRKHVVEPALQKGLFAA